MMASGLTSKELHEKYFDAKIVLSKYFMPKSDFKHDIFIERDEHLANFFSSENVKGDILMKYGGSFVTSSLLPACEFFKEIIIVDFLDTNLKVIDQWLKKEPGSFIPSELENDREMEMWIEKEGKIKEAIKQVIKAEIAESHLVAPELPAQADCILSEFCLEFLNTNKEGFSKSLKSMSSLLKVGGCLVMSVILECTFYIMDSFKFPVVSLEEEFVRKAVIDSGFVIKDLYVTPRTIKTLYSMTDFSSKLFLIAFKEEDRE